MKKISGIGQHFSYFRAGLATTIYGNKKEKLKKIKMCQNCPTSIFRGKYCKPCASEVREKNQKIAGRSFYRI